MLPLQGLTVIDLSRALAGPYCTALLADLGARVIKIESPNGDPTRSWPPFEGENSLYFDSINRNKESLCLDLYSETGKGLLFHLLAKADLLIENFKTGTMESMGLDDYVLHHINPDLVHVSVTAFGDQGPLRHRAGLDQVAQAMTGVTSVTGSVDGTTYRVGLPIIDITSGMIAAFTAVSLLLSRVTGGTARRGSTSLYETGLALSVFQGQKALSQGDAPSPQGNDHPSITPYGVFTTATEPIVLAVSTEKQWNTFCRLLKREDLLKDERYMTGRLRTAHREELANELERSLAAHPAEHWVTAFEVAGIPCGPILNYIEAMEAEQTLALGLIQSTTRNDGSPLRVLRGPVTIEGEPVAVRTSPPALGQHSTAILRELDLDSLTIQRLIDDGVLGCAQTTGAKVRAQ